MTQDRVARYYRWRSKAIALREAAFNSRTDEIGAMMRAIAQSYDVLADSEATIFRPMGHLPGEWMAVTLLSDDTTGR